MSKRIEVTDDDAEMIAGALRTSYSWLLDAWAYCAGASHGYNSPATEPRDVSGHIAKADRIEALCNQLGYPLDTGRRHDTEAYYKRVSDEWWLKQLIPKEG